MKFLSAITTAVVVLAASTQANATLQLTTGLLGGSGDVQNVLLTDTGPATTIFGQTNNTSDLVKFVSDENMVSISGGQARIEASDGLLGNVTYSLNDPTLGFTKTQFNIDMESGGGDVTISAIDNFGTVFDFGSQSLAGSGQNFFTIYSLDNQYIKSVTLVSVDGISGLTDLQQVRLDPTVVPIPAAAWLFGSGLIGLAGIARRKKLA